MSISADRVSIELGTRSYDIVIGAGILDRADSYAGLANGGGALIVTNSRVGPLYAERLAAALRPSFARVAVVELPDGEAHKDWPGLNTIFETLLRCGYDRRSTLFALGGGVVGDMTGFAAACYMRGVRYVQVPTTLLAQVDSSVGGKTAINHALGKNMIGVFNQPALVLADIDTLATLDQRELIAGLAEVVKYGPIADESFLAWTENHLAELLAREPQALRYAIKRSCEIKAGVVARDERESDLRAILNFGHTFGHAIETGMGHGNWLHGEAVGCGMVMAADLSARLGLIPAAQSARIRRLIERAGLPVRGPALAEERYLELMRVDKKAEAGAIRFVLLDGAGRAVLRAVPDDTVREVLRAHAA